MVRMWKNYPPGAANKAFFGGCSMLINPATLYILFRASRMARIKARLAGKGSSLVKSRNAEASHS